MSTTETTCRACGFNGLELILSLGRTPLANSLLTKPQLAQPEETFPLDLVFCPRCTLVQITETVPPEKLFREYLYFSSFSDTMLKHARELVDELIELPEVWVKTAWSWKWQVTMAISCSITNRQVSQSWG